MAGGLFSTAGTDLTKILSNPLAQAALGTYFGMISSPRRLGWGGALGRGGLAGLGQFAQAEQLQAQQPKLQAETQLDVTKAQQAKQQMATQQQMLNWLDKDPAAQKMDPQQRMILRLAVTSGHLQPGMLGMTPYQQAQLAQSKQRTSIQQQEAEQRIGLQRQGEQARERQLQALEATYPSEVAEREASAAHAQAGTAVESARLRGALPPEPEHADVAAEHQANTALAQEKLKRLRASGAEALTPQQQESRRMSIERQANKEADDAYKALLGTYWMKGHAPEHDKWVADYRNKRITELGGGNVPGPTAGAGSPMAGSSPTTPNPTSIPPRSASHSAVLRDFGL